MLPNKAVYSSNKKKAYNHSEIWIALSNTEKDERQYEFYNHNKNLALSIFVTLILNLDLRVVRYKHLLQIENLEKLLDFGLFFIILNSKSRIFR